MILSPYKKLFAALAILAVLLPSLFILNSKKAEAQVPVLDAANLQVNTAILGGVQSLVMKEVGPGGVPGPSWDMLLWVLVKNIIATMINDVTNWVRAGAPDGGPLFISNTKDFFLDAANEATGIFLDEYLDQDMQALLCQPWRNQVYMKLATQDRPALLQPEIYRPECTLEDIIDNAQGMREYMGDFRYGGWEAWLSMTDRPENNPFGAYLASLDKMQTAANEAKSEADTEAKMDQGFIGDQICESRTASGFCERWTIDSPGKWVEEQVSLHTSSGLRTLEAADELSELLGVLADQLINNYILGGLGGRLGL